MTDAFPKPTPPPQVPQPNTAGPYEGWFHKSTPRDVADYITLNAKEMQSLDAVELLIYNSEDSHNKTREKDPYGKVTSAHEFYDAMLGKLYARREDLREENRRKLEAQKETDQMALNEAAQRRANQDFNDFVSERYDFSSSRDIGKKSGVLRNYIEDAERMLKISTAEDKKVYWARALELAINLQREAAVISRAEAAKPVSVAQEIPTIEDLKYMEQQSEVEQQAAKAAEIQEAARVAQAEAKIQSVAPSKVYEGGYVEREMFDPSAGAKETLVVCAIVAGAALMWYIFSRK